MTRFWITLEQGVRLVLKAFESMAGGEIFVPKIPSTTIVDLAEAIAPGCKKQIVGIRPGEKLHECLIPIDDARHTLEFDDHYVVEPALHWWTRTDLLTQNGGRRCAEGFQYSSDTNPQRLSVKEIRELVKPFEAGLVV
jgi:UDP-N-acetylglucosamine 4,6-dehydratase